MKILKRYPDGLEAGLECSECRNVLSVMWKYCPNCGEICELPPENYIGVAKVSGSGTSPSDAWADAVGGLALSDPPQLWRKEEENVGFLVACIDIKDVEMHGCYGKLKREDLSRDWKNEFGSWAQKRLEELMPSILNTAWNNMYKAKQQKRSFDVERNSE